MLKAILRKIAYLVPFRTFFTLAFVPYRHGVRCACRSPPPCSVLGHLWRCYSLALVFRPFHFIGRGLLSRPISWSPYHLRRRSLVLDLLTTGERLSVERPIVLIVAISSISRPANLGLTLEPTLFCHFWTRQGLLPGAGLEVRSS